MLRSVARYWLQVGRLPHFQWKSHRTITIRGKTRCVLLYYDISKHGICPLRKCIYSFKVVKLFLKHPISFFLVSLTLQITISLIFLCFYGFVFLLVCFLCPSVCIYTPHRILYTRVWSDWTIWDTKVHSSVQVSILLIITENGDFFRRLPKTVTVTPSVFFFVPSILYVQLQGISCVVRFNRSICFS
jgi:hypothetical protein